MDTLLFEISHFPQENLLDISSEKKYAERLLTFKREADWHFAHVMESHQPWQGLGAIWWFLKWRQSNYLVSPINQWSDFYWVM